MEYGVASRFVGDLYGKILHRDSDPEGYSHYVYSLIDDKITPRQAIEEFLSCDEFIEKWVLNETPNQLASKLLVAFLGESAVTKATVKRYALIMINSGLEVLVSELLSDGRLGVDSNGLPVFAQY